MFLRKRYLGPRPTAVKDYLKVQRLLAEEEKRLPKVVDLADQGKASLEEVDTTHEELKARRAAVEAALERALDDLRKR